MSATSVKLLQAAAEIVGGSETLAARLGVDEALLLSSYVSGRRELPDALLLRAVDIILADRLHGSGSPGISTPAPQPRL